MFFPNEYESSADTEDNNDENSNSFSENESHQSNDTDELSDGDDENNYSSYDSENSDDDDVRNDSEYDSETNSINSSYPEQEELSAKEALDWIFERQEYDDEGGIPFFVEYPDLDCKDIVERISGDDLEEVIDEVLEYYFRSGDKTYFSIAKELMEEADPNVEMDNQDILNRCLLKALNEDDQKEVDFFIKHGANQEAGALRAIESNSPNMLRLLDIEITAELIDIAVNKKAFKVLD